MKKFFLIFCLSTVFINAMQSSCQQQTGYVQELRKLTEQAAALAAKESPTPGELSTLQAQQKSINTDYDPHRFHVLPKLPSAPQEAPAPNFSATIRDWNVSIRQYIKMIRAKIKGDQ